nr:pyridoxal-phosphate dependent enzyme [Pacificimonas pallii]
MGIDLSPPAALTHYFNFRHGHLIVKNEAERFGLGSFKALGGYYAAAHLLEARRNGPAGNAAGSAEISEGIPNCTSLSLVTASAGNHGIGVAAAASLLDATALVFLPRTTPQNFVHRLRQLGAEVRVLDGDYDDAVEQARSFARTEGHTYLPDTSEKTDDHTVHLVMEGYSRMADEMEREFQASSRWPNEIFLQAGVGTFAAALTQQIRVRWSHQPRIYIVEPDKAACLAHAAGDRVRKPDQAEASIMQRLDCKVPSAVAVERLRELDVSYVQVSDEEALGARSRLKTLGLRTSPSGAAGMAAHLKQPLDDAAERISLIILTERDEESAQAVSKGNES